MQMKSNMRRQVLQKMQEVTKLRTLASENLTDPRPLGLDNWELGGKESRQLSPKRKC